MIYLHRSDALFSPVIIDILTGKRCFDIDRGKKMPHKKLKSLDSQRKITDFAFGKHGQAQPNAGLETQNHTVNDTVDNDDSAAEKAGEKRDFQPRWLQQHHWLRYDKSQNKMICKLCSKIGAKNALSLGTDNFKTSTLYRHTTHKDHQRALIAPKEGKNFKQAVNKVLTNEETGITTALKMVYWLTQEGMPLSKYGSMLRFMKSCETPYLENLKVSDTIDYSSYDTAKGLLEALSNVIDTDTTEKMKDSPVITVLTDESTDIIVHHKLCINVRIVDPLTLHPSTLFLTDVRLEKATGNGIFSEIKCQLNQRNIAIKKVMGLGTDGASAMTGTKEGLTGHFLRANPHLVNTHCAAHRLALCTEQAAKSIPAMNDYQRTLEMIFYHFKKSPVKCDKVEAIQKLLDEPKLKYREVHQIRWLSFYEALDAVYRTLDSLLTYLSTASSTDPAAAGIKKKVGDELFVSLTYGMMDILPPVMKLSLLFQKKDLDIGIVQVAVDECVTSLQDIRDGVNPLGMPRFLSLLEKDLVNGVFKGHHHISRLKHPNQFQKAKRDFIDAIIQNVQKRFPDKELLTALSVLALRPISFLSEAELAEWGNDSIDQLGDFYGQPREHTYKNPATKVTETYRSEPVISATDVKAEWLNLKQVVKVQQYPRSSMASLWQLIAEYHKEDYQNLITLASLALTHPVHTADCERAFSSQNKVTTPARNRLSSDKCDQLMWVMIEGPARDKEPERLNTFFIRALTEWRTIKDRLIFCASKNQNKSQ